MEIYDQIRKISFGFFIILGSIHFLGGLLFSRNYFVPTSGLINRVSFIPFVIAGLTYLYAHLKCTILPKQMHWLQILFLILSSILLLALFAAEFMLPDSPNPLTIPK